MALAYLHYLNRTSAALKHFMMMSDQSGRFEITNVLEYYRIATKQIVLDKKEEYKWS